MRLMLSSIAAQAPRLLGLPWAKPLEEWAVGPLRQSELHRHVIRSVEDGGVVWVIKELPQRRVWREYRLLGQLADLGIPSVSVQGVVVDRAPGVDAALVTRYLEYSSTYQDLYRDPRYLHHHDRLLDAFVALLVRLHLAGFYWGDGSLSNTLFRPDAGVLVAYLVAAETAELHPSLSDGQRRTDVSQTCEQVAGELLDLQAGGLLGADLDPVEVAFDIERRYQRLWQELTGERIVRAGEQGQRVSERLRRLNELGFDAKQVELAPAGPDRTRLRVTARAGQPGKDRELLYQRTGLVAQPHQARHLLNELSSYRAGLEANIGRPVSDNVAANQWLDEIYDPVAARIPADLRDNLDPVEVLNDVLERHRTLSETAGHEIGIEAAAATYFAEVQPQVPGHLTARRRNGSVRERGQLPAQAAPPRTPPHANHHGRQPSAERRHGAQLAKA